MMLRTTPICSYSSADRSLTTYSSPVKLQRRSHLLRRQLLASLAGAALLPMLKGGGDQAIAAVQPLNVETDAADSPYIQELLRRTEEFREQRRKERLAAYDRRNFRDYFAFESSSLDVAKSRGISEETYYAIQKWMSDNENPKPIR